ncbi:hypothetical protein [Nocardia sp. NBC_00511]|uniref:hypothetical protein n=1 Tax=Nocardia sp. NBC_00511 TaxID=2903591 RepID=UPI0030E15DCC
MKHIARLGLATTGAAAVSAAILLSAPVASADIPTAAPVTANDCGPTGPSAPTGGGTSINTGSANSLISVITKLLGAGGIVTNVG